MQLATKQDNINKGENMEFEFFFGDKSVIVLNEKGEFLRIIEDANIHSESSFGFNWHLGKSASIMRIYHEEEYCRMRNKLSETQQERLKNAMSYYITA